MTWTDVCIGVTAKRLSKRVVEYAGGRMKSHIVRHCLNTDHETVNTKNFQI